MFLKASLNPHLPLCLSNRFSHLVLLPSPSRPKTTLFTPPWSTAAVVRRRESPHVAYPLHCSTKHVAGCPVSRSVTLCCTFPHSSTVCVRCTCTHSVPRVPSSAHFFNYVCCSCFLRFFLIQIKCATITFYLSKWLTLQTPPETKVLDSQKAPETDLFFRIFLFCLSPFLHSLPNWWCSNWLGVAIMQNNVAITMWNKFLSQIINCRQHLWNMWSGGTR